MFDRINREFGICVTVDQKRCAIVLSTPEGPNGHMPWLALGGLPHDAVVHLPAAILRASQSDIGRDASRYGSLISAAGRFYIRVGHSMGNYYTFNVETGQQEPLPQGKMGLAYSRWQVGVIVDDRFEVIFSYAPSEK